MPKLAQPMTAQKATTNSRTVGKYADGGGLYLRVRQGVDKLISQWLYRYRVAGRVREISLGPYASMTLREARMARDELKRLVDRGQDPMEIRQQKKRERRDERANAAYNTFEAAAQRTFKQRRHHLRGKNAAGQWLRPLELHLFPKLGTLPITDINGHAIYRELKGKYLRQPELCRKVLAVTSVILKEAKADGLKVDINATRAARRLLERLGQPAVGRHHSSLHFTEAPSLFHALSLDRPSQRLIGFIMLTGQRVGAMVQARWEHVDLEGGTMLVPWENQKTGKPRDGVDDYLIPLTPQMRRILEACAQHSDGRSCVFTSGSPSQPISANAPTQWLRRGGYGVTIHGFRSTIREFAQSLKGVSYEAKESLLNHKVLGEVQSAYYRSHWLDERRQIHEAWENYLVQAQADIIHLDRKSQ